MQENKNFRNPVAVTLLFTAIGFIIFAPVLGNGFLSDDYDSLYRIYIEKRILYREFLRPMIDISFYLNYLISGLSPWSYYVFNVSVHIINALLLFRLVMGFRLFSEKDQWLFATLSGFLFLIYPFHNESIVWLSGRLSSMACLFALVSLIIANERSGRIATLLSALFYLLGLLCYESIILLPVIIFIIRWLKVRSLKKLWIPGFFWLSITVFYLIIRFAISGEITGNYGDRVTNNNIKEKILNSGKVFGRLFLPGSEYQKFLIITTVLIGFVVIIILGNIMKSKVRDKAIVTKFKVLILFSLISLIIPVTFGVSTRTSESDRLLYFPSGFICMLIASSILLITKNNLYRFTFISIISVYFLFFLEINNRRWVKASLTAEKILEEIRIKGSKNIVLINMPDELEGAFVFRNGFMKALMVNKMDTSQVSVINYLRRKEYIQCGTIIIPQMQDSSSTIYPYTRIVHLPDRSVELTTSQNNSTLHIQYKRNLIYYWNKERLIRLF
jgi:hypothetical protein